MRSSSSIQSSRVREKEMLVEGVRAVGVVHVWAECLEEEG